MPKVTLSIRSDEELKERISALAQKERRTASQMTVILLEEALISRLLKEVRNGNDD